MLSPGFTASPVSTAILARALRYAFLSLAFPPS
jgi:hypothetical protein